MNKLWSALPDVLWDGAAAVGGLTPKGKPLPPRHGSRPRECSANPWVRVIGEAKSVSGSGLCIEHPEGVQKDHELRLAGRQPNAIGERLYGPLVTDSSQRSDGSSSNVELRVVESVEESINRQRVLELSEASCCERANRILGRVARALHEPDERRHVTFATRVERFSELLPERPLARRHDGRVPHRRRRLPGPVFGNAPRAAWAAVSA